MKARELRIGNLVEYNGEIFKVKGLSKNSVIADRGKGEVSFTYEEIGPIPLNEQLLFKFGFSSKDYKGGYIGIDHKCGGIITDFVLCYPKKIGEFQNSFAWEYNKFMYKQFEFVHDIQNLYFALTGEELTIKQS